MEQTRERDASVCERITRGVEQLWLLGRCRTDKLMARAGPHDLAPEQRASQRRETRFETVADTSLDRQGASHASLRVVCAATGGQV